VAKTAESGVANAKISGSELESNRATIQRARQFSPLRIFLSEFSYVSD